MKDRHVLREHGLYDRGEFLFLRRRQKARGRIVLTKPRDAGSGIECEERNGWQRTGANLASRTTASLRPPIPLEKLSKDPEPEIRETGRDRQEFGDGMPTSSGQCVPGAAPAAVQNEVPFFKQVAEMRLQRIPARAGDCHNVADGDPPMFTCIFDDLQGKLR